MFSQLFTDNGSKSESAPMKSVTPKHSAFINLTNIADEEILRHKPKTAREMTEDSDEVLFENAHDEKDVKEEIILITKPPTGRSSLKEKKKPLVNNIMNKSKEKSLMDFSDDSFNLLDVPDCDADFMSSLSSSSSQIDYDNLAMEAMYEADKIENSANSKTNKLHNYPSSRVTSDKFYSNTKNIDIIEEDFENEMDSDYSITIKRGINDPAFNELLESIKESSVIYSSYDES